MIKQFFDQLAEINWIVPGLVRAIIVVIVITLAWIVASWPAYFAEKVLSPALKWAADLTFAACKWLFDSMRTLFSDWRSPVERFVVDHAQMYSLARENSQIARRIAGVDASVQSIPKRIASLDATVAQAGSRITQSSNALSQLILPATIAPPTSAEFQLIQLGKNKSLSKTIIGGLLAAIFIAINTGMLNQFFESFMAGQEYFGVDAALVLAALFSIAELSFGASLVFAAGSTPGKIIVQAIIILFTVMLAAVEAAFYAKLGSGWTLFDSLFAPDPVPAPFKMFLGVFGLVLVGGLTFTSHLFVTGIVGLGDNTVVRQWRNSLKLKAKSANEIAERLASAERASVVLRDSMTELQTVFDTAASSKSSNMAIMEAGKEALKVAIGDAQAVRLAGSQPLDRGAMLRLLFSSIAIAMTAVFAVAIIAVVFARLSITNGIVYPIGPSLGWIIALAEAVFSIGAGYAAMRENSIIPAQDGLPARNVGADWIGVAAATVIMTTLTIANAYYVFQYVSVTPMFWFSIITSANFYLCWSGGRLGLMSVSVWSLFRCTIILVGSASLSLAALFTGAIGFTLNVFRAILGVLSFPYYYFVLRDPNQMLFKFT